MARTIEQVILEQLANSEYPLSSYAFTAEHTLPAVRVKLAQLWRAGKVTRTGDNYFGYRYSLPTQAGVGL